MKRSSLSSPDKKLVALVSSSLHCHHLLRLLRNARYRVRYFPSAASLFNFLKTTTPDAVMVESTFSNLNSRIGRELVRTLRKRFRSSLVQPAIVCLSPIWSARHQEEILREGAAFAWLSDDGEILRTLEYAIHSRSSKKPVFRAVIQNTHDSSEISDGSHLEAVVLVKKDGSEMPLPLTNVPLLVFVYLLLRNGRFEDIESICEEMNDIPFYYGTATKARNFTYDGIKEVLYRIRKSLPQFLEAHGYSFGKVWIEEPLDGDKRKIGVRINAILDPEIRTRETVLEHGFKL
jgi:hypothetical protein